MQGFNQGRYVPPEHEGITSGNALHKRRAAGTLRKDGSQTVRFELPFAIWCTGCSDRKPASRPGQPSQPTLIGQGVRFNAAKTRVGKYLSTPIWSFAFTHPACGGRIEIRTDPEKTRYVVFSGARERDYGIEKAGENGEVVLTPSEREDKRESAFAVLEEKKERVEGEKEGKMRVQELLAAGERDWRDPWTANRRVRDGFRRERKVLVREKEEVEGLQRRLGTEMQILPVSEEDARRAALVDFGNGEPSSSSAAALGDALFPQDKPRSVSRNAATSSLTPARRAIVRTAGKNHKDALRHRLLQNTRAKVNPFG